MGVAANLFAFLYDLVLSRTEKRTLAAHRRELLAGLGGRVLEIGAGTGACLPYYPDELAELVLTEPAPAMIRRLERRLARLGREAVVVQARAEALPFPDHTFDAAVATLALCTVSNPDKALAELRRVLVSGGLLVFVEHVRSDEQRLGRWQDRLARPWQAIGQGCRLNRRTAEAIERAGFQLERIERTELRPGPALTRPLIVGVARAAS